MMIAAFFAALLQTAPDPALSGFYMSSTHEVGAAIELDPDGKFMFALDYGAISERAEGTWLRDGANVIVTANEHQMNVEAPKFDATQMRIDGNSLWLERHGVSVRFEREGDLALPPHRGNPIED